MKIIYFIAVLFLLHTLHAQNYIWTDTLQFDNDHGVTSLLNDDDGNVYVASAASGPSIISVYYCGDVHLRKYTAAGALMWEKIFPGSARIMDMTFDAEGDIIAGGAFTNEFALNGEVYETPPFVAGMFLLKMDTDGNIIWAQADEPAVFSNMIYSLATDAAGNIYAVGLTDDITAMLRKYNTEGELILEGDLSQVRTSADIAIDSDNNVYICGSAPDYAMLDGISIPESATGTGYVNFFANYDTELVAQEVFAEAYFTFDFNTFLAKNSEGVFWRFTNSPAGTFDYYNTILYYHFLSGVMDTVRSVSTGFDFPLITMRLADDTSVWLMNNFSFETGLLKINTEGEVIDSIELAGPALELETFACNADNLWLGGFVSDAVLLDTFSVSGETGDNYQPYIARYGITDTGTTVCFAAFSWTDDGLELSFANLSSPETISYEWNFGDGETSTEMNPEHNYAAGGEYSVCLAITTSDDCTDTICNSISVSPVIAVDEIADIFFISPDPFIQSFDIHLPAGWEIVSIIDISGKRSPYSLTTVSSGTSKIQMEMPVSGMYILQINNGDEMMYKKVMAKG